jgi:hypothetical protein
VSPVCLGSVVDPRVVPAAFDAGVNFFFLTADMHWPIYENLRRGLAMLFQRGGGVRDEIVVGAVSYVTQPEFCHAPFREVVTAVPGLGHLDVTIAGGAYGGELPTRLAEYRRHRAVASDGSSEGTSGRSLPGVAATAASFHDRAAARLALQRGDVDLAFVRYNPVHRGAAADLFPHLPAERAPGERAALVYNFTSSQGHLAEEAYARLGLAPNDWRPEVTDYYRYALTRPEVDGLLCALAEPRHVAALDAALDRGPLDAESCTYLEDLADLSTGRAQLAGQPPSLPSP